MSSRHKVEQLPDDEFQFVIQAIIDGGTDRTIAAAFQKQFNKPLAKSSLSRWREVTGNELAERYRITRFQAAQLLKDLKEDPEADKYGIVLAQIEERLLT